MTQPLVKYPIETLTKPRKMRKKTVPVREHFKDSITRTNKLRLDSLYKKLLQEYEQKRTGK